MSYFLSWDRDGRDWPHREASRFIEAAGLRWHVQIMGQGPAALLLQGTGGSTHSFRDLAPLLARRFTVVMPDLPGHGLNATPAPSTRLPAPPPTNTGFTLLGVSPASLRCWISSTCGQSSLSAIRRGRQSLFA